MFCDKPHVNTLTSLLLAHGLHDAVVCPGSRNAVIIHNLHEADFNLYPVTDERSAAFIAIGLWLAIRRPIIVCVTSGSALLNLLPGVAEAAFRRIPLFIISADRPAQWIGQLDGQTLPQHGALQSYASAWTLPELTPSDTAEHHWYCNRVANEALSTLNKQEGPVHLNVPISEPLFSFSVPQLPVERIIHTYHPLALCDIPEHLQQIILQAKAPLLVIGQYEDTPLQDLQKLKSLGWKVFAENISNHAEFSDGLPTTSHDVIVHIGGAFVNKDIKLLLRRQQPVIIRIDDTNEMPDTFCHLAYKLRIPVPTAVNWLSHLCTAGTPQVAVSPSNHSLATLFHSQKCSFVALFLGNSTAVRWAERHISRHRLAEHTYCNRGTNGIEGCLSVAAGYSLATKHLVLCILGDLSFFYDANALWNVRLCANLRIMLLNNGHGGIFSKLPGLAQSPALTDYIAASHPFTAKGIAASFDCTYLSQTSSDLTADFDCFLEKLMEVSSERPVVMEIFVEDENY